MSRLFLVCAASGALLASVPGCRPQEAAIAPAQAVAKGWEDYNAALYDDAESLFTRAARQTSATDEIHLRALYGQATTINLQRPGGDAARAVPVYREIIRLAPKGEWAAWSLLALARMVHLPPGGDAPNLSAVIAAYQPVIDQFPFSHAGEEAFAFQQSARVASFQAEEARTAMPLMERFVIEHPASVFRSHVYFLLGRAYQNTGEYEKAVAAMIRFYELYHVDPKNPRSNYADVYWAIANLANYRAGDFATARRFYGLMIEEYPTERRVFTAKLAVRTMDEIEARLRATAPSSAPPP